MLTRTLTALPRALVVEMTQYLHLNEVAHLACSASALRDKCSLRIASDALQQPMASSVLELRRFVELRRPRLDEVQQSLLLRSFRRLSVMRLSLVNPANRDNTLIALFRNCTGTIRELCAPQLSSSAVTTIFSACRNLEVLRFSALSSAAIPLQRLSCLHSLSLTSINLSSPLARAALHLHSDQLTDLEVGFDGRGDEVLPSLKKLRCLTLEGDLTKEPSSPRRRHQQISRATLVSLHLRELYLVNVDIEPSWGHTTVRGFVMDELERFSYRMFSVRGHDLPTAPQLRWLAITDWLPYNYPRHLPALEVLHLLPADLAGLPDDRSSATCLRKLAPVFEEQPDFECETEALPRLRQIVWCGPPLSVKADVWAALRAARPQLAVHEQGLAVDMSADKLRSWRLNNQLSE